MRRRDRVVRRRDVGVLRPMQAACAGVGVTDLPSDARPSTRRRHGASRQPGRGRVPAADVSLLPLWVARPITSIRSPSKHANAQSRQSGELAGRWVVRSRGVPALPAERATKHTAAIQFAAVDVLHVRTRRLHAPVHSRIVVKHSRRKRNHGNCFERGGLGQLER